MSTTREPCGCRHNGQRWLELCPKHEQEFNELHKLAQADRNGLPDKQPEPWE